MTTLALQGRRYHGPPHFHARHAQGNAKVQIDTLEVIDTPGRAARERRRARAGETLQPIEPLRLIGLTPDITEGAGVRHGVLRLRFADGLTGEVDVLDRMRGPVFDEARTPEGFGKVRVDPRDRTVVWPGGADLAPDTLYERVRTGAWPEQDVAA